MRVGVFRGKHGLRRRYVRQRTGTDPPFLAVRPTGKTLAELLGDRPAVLIDTASGGDTTPDGNFASPVQCAYLYQSGRLVGRLPEFSVRGSLFDLFGAQYLGCSTDRPFSSSHALVMEMEIT